jgi:hypothetical protein
MRPSRVPCNRTNWVELWGCHKWEDFTTDTNDGQPERVPSSPYYLLIKLTFFRRRLQYRSDTKTTLVSGVQVTWRRFQIPKRAFFFASASG